jgi:hypothetical protein
MDHCSNFLYEKCSPERMAHTHLDAFDAAPSGRSKSDKTIELIIH